MPLALGPEATLAGQVSAGPSSQVRKGGRARARCRASATTTVGAVGRARARGLVHSTRGLIATLNRRRRCLIVTGAEATTVMADGGVPELRRKRPCRRYLAQSEGAKGYSDSHSHHEAVGLVGEIGGSPESSESTRNVDQCSCSITAMSTRCGHSAKRSSAWT